MEEEETILSNSERHKRIPTSPLILQPAEPTEEEEELYDLITPFFHLEGRPSRRRLVGRRGWT
jgi:hypothetical protein